MTPAMGTAPSWCTPCWTDCLSSLWTPRLVRLELGSQVRQLWDQATLTRCLSLGVVRTAIPNMDRETQEEFLVVIQAKDMGGHMGGLSGSTTVTVTLSDVNDNPPKFPQSKGPVPPPEPSFNHPAPPLSPLEKPAPNPSPNQGEKDVLGEEGGLRTSLRTSPSIHPKACTSSLWWRPLGRVPWWAGCGPRTQTWGTTPSWHTASSMGRGRRPSASAQTPRVEMGSSLSAR